MCRVGSSPTQGTKKYNFFLRVVIIEFHHLGYFKDFVSNKDYLYSIRFSLEGILYVMVG